MFCAGVVTIVPELGTVLSVAAPLKLAVPLLTPAEVVVPEVVVPDALVPTPDGLVVTVPEGETDMVPVPFSVAVGAVLVPVPVVVPLAVVPVPVGEVVVVTVLGVTVPFGEVVPIAVCEDVVVPDVVPLPLVVPVPVPLVVPAPVPLVVPPDVPDVVCAIDAPAANARVMAEMRMRVFMRPPVRVQR